MNLLRPRTLTQALWLLLAAVVAPLLLGTLVLLAVQTAQENQLARSRLGALTQTLLQAVDAEFDRGRAQLEVLAASQLIDAGDLRQLRTYAAEVVRAVPGSLVVLVGPDGQMLFNTAVPWGETLPNLWTLGAQSKEVSWEGRMLPLSSGNLSRQAFETGSAVYSDLYFGVQVQRPALSVAIPVVREGQARFALILSYPPAVVQERIRSSVTVADVRVALVDRRGVVVASNDAAVTRTGERILPMATQSGKTSGYYRVTSKDGVKLTGAYAVSPHSGFTVRVSQPHTGDLLPVRLTSLAWIAMLLASIVASVALAGLLSRRLARPLRELGEDVRLGRAPPAERETGIAEIDLLVQALREGVRSEAERVQEQTLRQVAQGEQTLLQKADRQKDEFLATLAHELRNPLAPIRTAVELLRLRGSGDPMVERARAVIERQALHLSRLVNDLLDVSRITLGRIQLQQERVDLGDVAASAAEANAQALAQRGLQLEREVHGQGVFVQGDPTRLAQCVMNLLNNAVKFTPPGGRVALRVRQQGGQAIVEVQDHGVGISPENLDRIFELFVQERRSGHDGNTGLGIGLALTRRLVELHGGTVHATSAGLGRGSTFSIELPAVQAPEQQPAKTVPANETPAQGLRVLVVDDNADAADTLAELLQLSGFDVSRAQDGLSAVRAVSKQRPDAVLLDIGLPDIDGYEACRRMRSDTSLAKQPLVIAVTGWGQQSDREAAREAGFDGHLTKPVAFDKLMALLQSLQAEPRA